MKKNVPSLLAALWLACTAPVFAQHEFYTASPNTYGVNKNSFAGAIVRFDSLLTTGTKLHQFDSITGGNAMGSVIQATDGKLYGITFYGGEYDRGVLYAYDLTIDSLEVKASLPMRCGFGPLQASNGKLYFVIASSGGYLMEYDIATNTLTSLFYLPYPEAPKGGLTEVNGKLYGVETIGGPLSWGRMFEYNLSTRALKYVYNFGVGSGSQPQERPVYFPDNNLLYGIVRNVPNGNPGTSGGIYSFNPATGAYAYKLDIPAAIGYGYYLTVAPNHKIYGLSAQGGTDASGNHFGSIFEYTPGTNTIRLVHSFGMQADGSFTGSGYTEGGMTLAANGKIYGATASHIFCFDYLTDKVTAPLMVSNLATLGFDINFNGFLKEVCRKPSYKYFKNKTVTLCPGDAYAFTVQSDNARKYIWKKDGGIVAGQASSTLQLTSATASDNGTYTCLMTNSCGTTETTGSIQVTVTQPPTPVIAATGPTTFCEGNSVTLTSTLSGQWSTGDTGTSLVATQSGSYFITYASACGPRVSNTVDVAANPVPMVVTQPIDADVVTGDNASFTVTAQASPVRYQWQIDDGSGFEDVPDAAPYSGAITSRLKISGAVVAQDGYAFRCVVWQDACSDTSAVASLFVTTPLAAESTRRITLSVYPNPATATVRWMARDGIVTHSIQIKNALGQTVYAGVAADAEIDVARLAQGVYTLEITSGGNAYLGRFAKD